MMMTISAWILVVLVILIAVWTLAVSVVLWKMIEVIEWYVKKIEELEEVLKKGA